MSCLDLGLPQLPDIPGFFLAGAIPGVPLPATVGVFCCKFTIPDPGINLIIQGLNAGLAAATGAVSAEAMAFVIALENAESAVQAVLDQIHLTVDCPFS